MKTSQIFTSLALIIFLSNPSVSVSAQDPNYPLSYYELVAGDTSILRQDPGYCGDLDKLVAMLSPNSLHWPEYCPDCRPDTIFSFRTEPVPDIDSSFYFYFIIPVGTLPGIYDAIGLCDGSPLPWSGWITVYTPPLILVQPSNTIVCAGDNASFSVSAHGNKYEDLVYEWYHNDSLISSTIDSELIIESAGSVDTGRYYCVISNPYGVDTTRTVFLGLHPYPDNPGTPAGPDRFCGYVDSSVYSIPSDPMAAGYSWMLYPAEAGTVEQHDTSCTIFWEETFSGLAKLCVELISGDCGINTSDTLEITIPGISIAPDICIVGIDEQTGKYRIVWERSAYGKAELFRIYRESNQADVYLEIGTVDTSEISFFVDTTSVPEVLPHRYKINYLDSCGLESEISTYHQTMHLVANIGIGGEVNLMWSEYEGIPFPTYTIYRGTHPDSMSLFMQVPSTVTSYKDLNPPVGEVYYQIGMSNPDGCDPVKKSESNFSSSLSNRSLVIVTNVTGLDEDNPFTVFPNPATNTLHFQFDKLENLPMQLTVYNSLGKKVLKEYIREREVWVDVSGLTAGIYILQLDGDSEIYTMQFVIDR